jgi:hypothetical protein
VPVGGLFGPLRRLVLQHELNRLLLSKHSLKMVTPDNCTKLLKKAYNQELMNHIIFMQRETLRPLTTLAGLAALYNYENPSSVVNLHVVNGIKRGVDLLEREMKEIVATTIDFNKAFNDVIKS